MDADIFHFGDEVQDVAAVFALAETIPNVFAEADAELRRVAALVNRTGPAEAVLTAFKPVKQTVMLEDLLHVNGRFDGLEVNER